MSRIMKAVVIHEPGPPEVLKIEEQPVPVPNDGWVLIEIKAFGINRSELFTRRGHSPTVKFPRILGIEVVGVVVEAPGSNYEAGQTVAVAKAAIESGVSRINIDLDEYEEKLERKVQEQLKRWSIK